MYKASLIISIFNKIEALKLVLASLEMQTEKDFEVIIADDGSRNEVVDEISTLLQESKLNIKHCWHEDNGWRKNIILNQAIRNSESEYLIFIDGDCLAHKEFIKSHLYFAEKGTVLTGRRVNLSARISEKITLSMVRSGYLGMKIFFDSLLDIPSGSVRDLEQGPYLGNTSIGKWLNRKDKGILGCNFSIGKREIYDVNGFDERFVHPAAGEDTDLENRLRRKGITVKTVRNRAIQYHLYHKELPRVEARLQYLNENDENLVTYTPFGIIRE